MSYDPLHDLQDTPKPRRSLRADFTAATLQLGQARLAEQLHTKVPHTNLGTWFMNLTRFARQAPVLTAAVVMLSAGTAYAAAHNWFQGDITAQRNGSIISVDLTGCANPAVLPGFESSDKKVSFKVLKDPAITPAQLRSDLLTACEDQTIRDFYTAKSPLGAKLAQEPGYTLNVGKIRAIGSGGMVTVDYFWGGTFSPITLKLSDQVSVYNQGQASSLGTLKPGMSVIYVAHTTDMSTNESTPRVNDQSTVESLFATQYDLEANGFAKTKAYYDVHNIMPLGMYENLNK